MRPFLVTDLPADRHAWRRGRKRFWIEPMFRDWKSSGFDLGSCRLNGHVALDGLVLGMAVTTLWMVNICLALWHSSRRSQIDIPYKRDYRLFRLGRDYVQRAELLDWPVPVQFTVDQPAPAR